MRWLIFCLLWPCLLNAQSSVSTRGNIIIGVITIRIQVGWILFIEPGSLSVEQNKILAVERAIFFSYDLNCVLRQIVFGIVVIKFRQRIPAMTIYLNSSWVYTVCIHAQVVQEGLINPVNTGLINFEFKPITRRQNRTAKR